MAVTSKKLSSSSSSQEQQHVLMQIPEPQPPSQATDECIQTLCTQWRERLQQCVVNYNARNNNGDSDTRTTVITATTGSSSHQRWQEQYKVYTAYHLEIYQLKQELQKFWLLYSGSGRNDYNDKTTTSTMAMQTRHDELRKCQDLLDMIQSNHRDSKGTSNAVPFLFYKYRLRQPTRNLPTTVNTSVEKRSSAGPSDVTQKQTASTTLLPSSATIEHLINTIILIDKEGNIQYQTQPPTDVDDTGTIIIQDTNRRDASNIERMIPKPQTSTSETIVIRNLSNCHIQLLGNYYKSIYFVKVVHTKIHLYYPVMGAIHVTECHDISFINILQAQQLRLHNSHDIHCNNATIHAGTILEDCHNVTFYVPPSSTTNLSNVRNSIKDFNWLRNGVPSPNFSIQTMSDLNTTTMVVPVHCRSGSASDPSVYDHGTMGRPDQYSASVSNNDNSDDDDEI